MNRDSIVWSLGLAAALLTAIVNQAGLFPAAWYPWIGFAALLVGVISGYLKASPLKGNRDL
jgi:hypothetical protein